MNDAAIQAKIVAVTEKYGGTCDYLAFAGAPSNLYRQGAATFAAAVTLKARWVYEPTQEAITQIGSDERFDIGLIIPRSEVLTHLSPPNDDLTQSITNKDRLVVEGRTFEVVRVHATGTVFQKPHMLVVLANTRDAT